MDADTSFQSSRDRDALICRIRCTSEVDLFSFESATNASNALSGLVAVIVASRLRSMRLAPDR